MAQEKSKKTIHLSLSPEEIVCLQELVQQAEDSFCGYYGWEMELHRVLRKKLQAAYRKPYMSEQIFNARLEKCRKEWAALSNSYITASMLRAVERELRFAYRIEKGVEDLDE